MVSIPKRLAIKDQENCPHCGGKNTTARTYSDTVDFRGLEFDVDELLDTKCLDCKHSWETADQGINNFNRIREAYGSERDRLRAKQGLLTGQEIQRIRNYFGLTQREAATLFGGGFNAFNKYESGEVLQSAAMDRLLRLTYALGQDSIKTLEAVATKGKPLLRIRVVKPEPDYEKIFQTIVVNIRRQPQTTHITTHPGTTNVATTRNMEMMEAFQMMRLPHVGSMQ